MNNLSIWFSGLRGKLLILVILPTVFVICLSYLSITKMQFLGNNLEKAATVRLPLTQYTGDMDSALNGVARFLWSAHGAENNQKERSFSIQKTKERLSDFKKAYDEYIKLPRTDKMKELFKPVEENISSFFAAVDEALVLFSRATPKDDDLGKVIITTKIRQSVAPMGKAFEEMDIARREATLKENEENSKGIQETQTILISGGIISTLTLFIFGIIIASRLAQTLAQVTQRISDSGSQVSTASEQLSSASQQLSSGATEAASSLEETVSSLEELSSMVKLNADNAKEAASLSQSSRTSAEDGEREIRNLIGAMTDISNSSKKIEEIINVIDDIAFQTNLLALNAAVEAARAGEQGKGFAVVAEAVRNLAHRSGSAAKDINVLIKESVEKVGHGGKIADQSGEVLKNIVTSVKKVADLNNEIASASAEQSNGISQISKAMNELDQATQRNAASAEETAASSEEMSAQAIELQGLVNELTKVIEGAGRGNQEIQNASDRNHHERKTKGGTGKGSHGAKLKVVPSKVVAHTAAHRAEKAIPFEEEDSQTEQNGKVGNLDGF